MDPKELRGLYEAYSEVYAPREENIEEGLRSAVKRLFGGKEQEPAAPESRGAQLRKKYNVGPEKSDTSAKRQILDRSRARAERDEKDFGDKPFQKQVAQKSKDAHNRYLKAGYSKYGAGDARGSGNKARKRAAALSQEDFNWIVDTLLDEGYDLSTYTVEEFYDMCIDENRRTARDPEASEKERTHSKQPDPSKAGFTGIGNMSIDQIRKMSARIEKNQKEDFDVFDVVLEFLQVEGYAETLEEAEWLMANMIDEEAIDIILGEAEGSYGRTPKATAAYGKLAISRMNKPAGEYSKRGEKTKKIASAEKHMRRSENPDAGNRGKKSTKPSVWSGKRSGMTQKDRDYSRGEAEYGHTGYDPDFDGGPSGPGGKPKGKKAERQKKTGVSAEAFDYVNEAQHARNNPEKYEREQSKKSAPVRGEKTPMPPRGDKRREDFEKWYAANVR